MESISNNQIKSLSTHFDQWNNIMNDYYDLMEDFDKDNEDDLYKYDTVTLKLHYIFETILRHFVSYGKLKDSFDFPARTNFFRFVQQAIVGSKKLGVDFDFGIDYGNFCLSTYIRYPIFIKNMDDHFWSNFITLHSLGNFYFLEDASPSSDEGKWAMKKTNKSNSSIFRLINNYIIFSLYEREPVDIGWIKIEWPITTAWDIIINNGSSAFKCLYKINYMLYRVGYLHYRNNVKHYK